MGALGGRSPRLLARCALGAALAVLVLCTQGCAGDRPTKPWHTAKLTEEFTADMIDATVRTFEDYLALEERLFGQLDELVFAKAPNGPEYALVRFSPTSSRRHG